MQEHTDSLLSLQGSLKPSALNLILTQFLIFAVLDCNMGTLGLVTRWSELQGAWYPHPPSLWMGSAVQRVLPWPVTTDSASVYQGCTARTHGSTLLSRNPCYQLFIDQTCGQRNQRPPQFIFIGIKSHYFPKNITF